MKFTDIISYAFYEERTEKIIDYLTDATKPIDYAALSGFIEMFNNWQSTVIENKHHKDNPFLVEMDKQQFAFFKNGFINLGFNEKLIDSLQHFLYEEAIKENSVNLLNLVLTDKHSIDVNAMIQEQIRWEISGVKQDKGGVKTWPLMVAIHNDAFAVMFKLIEYGASFTDEYQILSKTDCLHSRHPACDFMSFHPAKEFDTIGNQWWVPLVYCPQTIEDKFGQEISPELMQKMKKDDLHNEFIKQAKEHQMEEIVAQWEQDGLSNIIIDSILTSRARDSFYRYNEKDEKPLPALPSKEMLLAELFVTNGVTGIAKYMQSLDKYNLAPDEKQKEAILTLLLRKDKNIDFLNEWKFSVNNGKAIEQLLKKSAYFEKKWNTWGNILHTQYCDYLTDNIDKNRSLVREYTDNYIDKLRTQDNNRFPSHEHNVKSFVKRLKSLYEGVIIMQELYPDFRLNEEDKKEITESIMDYHDNYSQKLEEALTKKPLSSDDRSLYEKFNLSYQFSMKEIWSPVTKANKTNRI